MIKFVIIVSIFLLSILLPGCNKEDEFHDASGGKILTILNKDSETIGSFFYQGNGLLQKSISHEDYYMPEENAEFDYSYNSDNILIKKSGYQPGIMYMSSTRGAMGRDIVATYEYDSNLKLSKITTDYDYSEFPETNYRTVQTFNYPKYNLIIEYQKDESTNSEYFTSKIEYNYDVNDNIESKLTYYIPNPSNPVLSLREEFTYDNKKVPYQAEPTPKSKNNILTQTTTYYQYNEDGTESIPYPSVYTYSYTYTTSGYPESQTITYPNEYVFIKYFKY